MKKSLVGTPTEDSTIHMPISTGNAIPLEISEKISKGATRVLQSHFEAIQSTNDINPFEAEQLREKVKNMVFDVIEETWNDTNALSSYNTPTVLSNSILTQAIQSLTPEGSLGPIIREILISTALSIKSLIKVKKS